MLNGRVAQSPRGASAAGFIGWSDEEAAQAAEEARAVARLSERLDDSDDDDGFFEQSEHSSLSDPDAHPERSPAQPPAVSARPPPSGGRWERKGATSPARGLQARGELQEWQAGVLQRAAETETRGALDVRALAGQVVRALPPPPAAVGIDTLLSRTATHDTDVSRVFLATLFLVRTAPRQSPPARPPPRSHPACVQANAGNVEVVQGPPLTLNSFSVRLLTPDERLYTAAAAADERQLR